MTKDEACRRAVANLKRRIGSASTMPIEVSWMPGVVQAWDPESGARATFAIGETRLICTRYRGI